MAFEKNSYDKDAFKLDDNDIPSRDGKKHLTESIRIRPGQTGLNTSENRNI